MRRAVDEEEALGRSNEMALRLEADGTLLVLDHKVRTILDRAARIEQRRPRRHGSETFRHDKPYELAERALNVVQAVLRWPTIAARGPGRVVRRGAKPGENC